MSSNLPVQTNDSADGTKRFFDQYFTESISYPSNQVDAVVGFFENKGFEKLAARSTATVILQQAKIDNVNVFEIIDTLKGLEDIQISQIVAEILNYNRQKSSTLGYKITTTTKAENRNIVV